ncbi:MAG: hypothetical protein WBC44_10815 [Planctomycetaceae bacterium]
MSSATTRPAWKIRPVLLVAVILVAVLTIDLDVVRGRGTRSAASRGLQSISDVRPGDSVRYRHDGLSYEVVATWSGTALLRRGDDLAYADQSDMILDR